MTAPDVGLSAIRVALQGDDLKAAVAGLLEHTERHAARFHNEMVQHAASLARLTTDSRKGLLSAETVRLERTRLCGALLDVLSAIEETTPVGPRKAGARPAPGVAISYSWKDSAVADEIDAALSARGVVLTRDVRDAPYTADIPGFMDRLARARQVILLVSDPYLKSRNCMYEALEFMEHGPFETRALPIVLPDAADIYVAAGTVRFLEYWDGRIDELNGALRKLRSMQNADRIYQELNHFARIRGGIDAFIDRIQRMNTRSLETHRASGFEAVLAHIATP